ncbi:MAG: phasin family protein [Caldilineaceae bacterium]|nr:phasin family protein [Caldilineaceae bacterium]
MKTLSVTNLQQETTPQRLAERAEQMRKVGHKAALAYLGLLGMAYDHAAGFWRDSNQLAAKAEKRGEALQTEARARLESIRASVRDEFKQRHEAFSQPFTRLETRAGDALCWLRGQLETQTDAVSEGLAESGKAVEAEIRQQVEETLTRLGIPSRDRLEQLSQELEAVSAKLDAQLAQPAMPPLPWPEYATLNARPIIAMLPSLTLEQLQAVRAFEEANASRITVMRAVDDELKARLAVA